MDVSRRDFLKISGGAVALGSIGSICPETASAQAGLPELRIENAKVTTTICPFCSVGCSILVHAKDGKVINTEGDPESPINEGSLSRTSSRTITISRNTLSDIRMHPSW